LIVIIIFKHTFTENTGNNIKSYAAEFLTLKNSQVLNHCPLPLNHDYKWGITCV